MEIADLSEDKMAYTVTVTYVFENVEANTPGNLKEQKSSRIDWKS